jgi:methionyl-tRNA formyltransferase
MRIVFMGTPAFAVPSLDAMLDSNEVVAAYTRPDAASGRGRRVSASAVKLRALEVAIPVEQPLSLRDDAAFEALRSYAPDLIVVAAYGAILPPAVIDLPRLGCVNVHASLLPAWRGAAPIQRGILAGDVLAGVSIMRMEEGLDTGPVCATRSTPVDGKDAVSLTIELASLGARLLSEVLSQLGSDACDWRRQDDAAATYAAKITAADVALEPGLTVERAWRRVRASGPSAPCRALVDGRRITILTAEPSPTVIAPGAVATDDGLELGMSDGTLRISRLTPEGRGAMGASDWLRGARLAPDSHWSAS